ncbi:MAG: site-specific DNA-methyltransferase [Fimbriimonadaceae bacterium]|nr:site-specific DNA-methyltransferase [Fimbriimonadaceae bacterium]
MDDQPALPLDTIHLGDCLDWLRSLPTGSVDLVVSSPPYNLGKEYEARVALDHYLQQQRAVLAECVRVLRHTGSLVWQVGAFADAGLLIPLDIRFFPILEDLGLLPRSRVVWARTHGLHGRRKFSCRHETLLWFTKSDNYAFDLDAVRVPQKYQNKRHYRGDRRGELSCNPAGKNPGDIWVFRNVKHNHEEQTVHPCQFPEDLIARVLLALTTDGAVVLDPYMGSGTVAVVAQELGRHYLGAETDPLYHEVALRRLAGTPDQGGRFPNLKTLRAFVALRGGGAEGYSFDVQVGARPTEQERSRIYPEEHHRQELEERLTYEEEHFTARWRGVPAPPPPHGQHDRPANTQHNGQASLFDD